jgi:hypothetical protein
MEERRGNWMEVVQEFDLNIKPAKLVKGKGLCKLAAEAQDQVNKDLGWENELELWCSKDSYVSTGKDSWYGKLCYQLHHGTFLENLNHKERRALRLKLAQYCLINSVLFCVNYDGVLLRCLKQEHIDKVMKDLHDGHIGGC